MLSVTPSGEPLQYEAIATASALGGNAMTETRVEFLLLNESDLPSDQFRVTTEYGSDGAPRAVISLRDGLEEIDDSLHTLQLELRVGEVVLQRQTVLIDIESAEFREQFLEGRVQQARRDASAGELEQIATWRSQLDSGMEEEDELLLAELTTEHIATATGVIENEPEPSVASLKSDIYAELADRVEVAKSELQAASDSESFAEAQYSVAKLGRSALLLADRLAADLASENPNVVAAAAELRDQLADVKDHYYTLFAGLGIDHVMSQTVSDDGWQEFVLAFVETGSFAANAYLQIELGTQQAMVQATLEKGGVSSSASGAALTMGLDDADIFDTYVHSSQELAYGTSAALQVQGSSSSDSKHTLLKVDLSTLADQVELPQTATLNLFATNSTIANDTTHVLSAHWDTWAWDADRNWPEDTFKWDGYESELDGGFGNALDTWDAVPGTNAVDITQAVQRALLFGDSNLSGGLDSTNVRGKALGDIEAFYTAVRYWDHYVSDNEANELVPQGLVYRNDGNWDGQVTVADQAYFFGRHGIDEGNYNLDGSVNGSDYSIWSANLGRSVERYTQGDGDFDGVVTQADYSVW